MSYHVDLNKPDDISYTLFVCLFGKHNPQVDHMVRKHIGCCQHPPEAWYHTPAYFLAPLSACRRSLVWDIIIYLSYFPISSFILPGCINERCNMLNFLCSLLPEQHRHYRDIFSAPWSNVSCPDPCRCDATDCFR